MSAHDVLTFALGALPSLEPAPVSGYGIRVRSAKAKLEWPALSPTWMRVAWREGGADFALETRTMNSDDLLHVAWSLRRDPVLARPRDGACAPDDAPPDAVVRTLFALSAGGAADAVADCWARERLADPDAQDSFARWGTFGPTTELMVRYVDRVGGRYWVSTTVTFKNDPYTLFGPHKLIFYLVGVEESRWRIFDNGTAVPALPPVGRPASRMLPVAEAFSSLRASSPLRLAPTKLPPGTVAVLLTDPERIDLRDDLHDVVIRIALAAHSPPPPSEGGTQRRLAFRSDAQALYEVNDATVPNTFRILVWTEPGVIGCERCQYLLSSMGLDDAAFWTVARSLR